MKIDPLAGWTKQEIRRHLIEHDVPYNPLHELGCPSIGCRTRTSPVALGENDRAGRGRGGAKTERVLRGAATIPDEGAVAACTSTPPS